MTGGVVVIRRFAVALAVLVACMLVGAGLLWLRAWDGSSEFRTAGSGERLSLEGGLSVVVPEGWEGYYTHYRGVPDWVPFRDARQDPLFHEQVDVRRTLTPDDPGSGLLALTYRGGAAPPGLPRLRVVSESVGVTVYRAAEPSSTVAVVGVAQPGGAPAYLFLAVRDGDAMGSVRRIWALTGIEGAVSP